MVENFEFRSHKTVHMQINLRLCRQWSFCVFNELIICSTRNVMNIDIKCFELHIGSIIGLFSCFVCSNSFTNIMESIRKPFIRIYNCSILNNTLFMYISFYFVYIFWFGIFIFIAHLVHYPMSYEWIGRPHNHVKQIISILT